MICQFCKCEIPDTQPFNFCPTCGQTIASFKDGFVALSALDVYCIPDRCPWVRGTV